MLVSSKAKKLLPGIQKTANSTAASDSDSSLLFGVLTLVLAIVAFVLLQVNSNLKKLADEKTGVHNEEPVPFWRNKSYIAMLTVLLFIIGGYLTVTGAINLGRTKDYQPTQPIMYSHKVHAGINQINCQYCHNGAAQGKHAKYSFGKRLYELSHGHQ
jgi:uncharacterized BrkB/YihY/UPF0761 family membrane protein